MKLIPKLTAAQRLRIISTTIGVLLLSGITYFFIAYLETSQKKNSLVILQAIRTAKKQQIEQFYQQLRKDARVYSNLDIVTFSLRNFSRAFSQGGINSQRYRQVDSLYRLKLEALLGARSYQDIYLVNNRGDVVFSVRQQEDFGTNIARGAYRNQMINKAFNDGKNTTSLTDFSNYKLVGSKLPMGFASSPVFDDNGVRLGVIIIRISAKPINAILEEKMVHNTTAIQPRIFIIGQDYKLRATSLPEEYSLLLEKRLVSNAARATLDTKGAIEFDDDKREVTTASDYLNIKALDWHLMVELPKSKARQGLNLIEVEIIFIVLLVILFFVGVLFFYNKTLKKPVAKVKEVIGDLSQGVLPDTKLDDQYDDIKIQATINDLIEGLKKTSHFASEIGKGNLEVDFKPLSENDELGNALLGMRNNLRQVAIEDKKRNWTTEGLAKFGEILRSNNDNVAELAYNIISSLVDYVGANQGGLFVLNDENKDDVYLELLSAYAFQTKKYHTKRIEIGEGVTGEAVREKRTIYMTDVPDEYVQITSGLGEANPRSVLVVPMKVNDQIHGVIEIASFETYEKYQIGLIEKLAESIASTIASVKVNEHTKKLVQQLRTSEEEIRQSMEELHATKEQMENKEIELTGQLDAINSTLSTIEFDSEGHVNTANNIFLDSMEYTHDGLARQPHKILVDPDYSQTNEYKGFWAALKKGESQSGEYKYVTSTGKEIWFNATYTPVKDAAGGIYKIIALATNITAQKKMALDFEGQLAAIYKSNMVVEYDMQGRIMYANEDFLKLVEYNLGEVHEEPHTVFIPEEDHDSPDLHAFWADLRRGNYQADAVRRKTKSGKIIWTRGSFNPILDLSGQPYKIVEFTQDITYHRELQAKTAEQLEAIQVKEKELTENVDKLNEVQEEMRQKEADMAAHLNAIDRTLATVEYDLRGFFKKANHQYLNTMGYTMEELDGQHDQILVDPEEAEGDEYQGFWKSLKRDGERSGEFRRISKSGKEIWWQATFTLAFTAKRKPYKVIMLARDITAQKQESLDVEGQLKAIRKSNGVMELDIEGKILSINDIYLEALDYTEEEVLGKDHKLFVKEEEKHSADFTAFWMEMVHGRFKTGVFEKVCKDGSIRWFRGSYNPIFDLKGKAYKIVHFAQDVTEAKQLEAEALQQAEELRTQEEEIRQNMEEITAVQEDMKRNSMEMEAALEAIDHTLATAELDLSATFMKANTIFADLVNFKVDELIGKNFRMLVEPKFAKTDEYLALWDKLANGLAQEGEIRLITKDHKEVWANVTYTPAKNSYGTIYKILVLVNDISELKHVTLDFQGMLKAFNQTNLMVEYDLNGMVTNVNDRFLELMHYEKGEVLGKHHKIFVSDTEKKTKKYKDFWQGILAGEDKSGDFLRVDNEGNKLWFKGSYHPIPDATGAPCKVVNYAMDITEYKHSVIEMEKLIANNQNNHKK
ncbi:PAS domain S-box protein [Microscilla marina]|uniref:PAS n=1 Tax=Microscilla marina ATCC 23134 TaxID=313606 RepID=A1ZM46_MICM2|nr:PAS domain S-box protein [Microscilla marina]EAY28578.1 PAS [Microscilla marina ATCC 23134]